jgi:hypothetical protein
MTASTAAFSLIPQICTSLASHSLMSRPRAMGSDGTARAGQSVNSRGA